MTYAAPTVDVAIDTINVDSVTVADITLTYGRNSIAEQPSPSTCTLTLLTDQIVLTPEVGMLLTVKATVSSTSYDRFLGTVTSVTAGRYVTTVTATSKGLGRLARVSRPDYLFDASLPGIGGNLQQLLAPTGVLGPPKPLTFTYSPGDTTVLPGWRVPAGNALAQCQTLAGYDTAGVFFEKPNGDLVFTDGNDRAFTNTTAPDIDLIVGAVSGSSGILDSWQATQSLDGLVNSAVITYGSPTRTVTVTDGTSVDEWGEFATAVEFPVVSVSDAIRKASRVVANSSQPRTVTNPVTVELTSVPLAIQALLLTAQVGTSIGWLPNAAASGIPGLPDATFLEGYVERIVGQGGTKGRHSMSLILSDVALTRTMQTWGNVTPTLAWNAVGATVTWYQLAGLNL